ncbi:hypothetical protein LINPERPRIM_LOCUS26450 [Linum perenne]
MDEFTYEDDDVRCFCELRASRRISRTEVNPNRKFFGCPLYYSAGEKNELESTLDRVTKHSRDIGSSSCSDSKSESNIVNELQAIKARLSRLEAVVFFQR